MGGNVLSCPFCLFFVWRATHEIHRGYEMTSPLTARPVRLCGQPVPRADRGLPSSRDWDPQELILGPTNICCCKSLWDLFLGFKSLGARIASPGGLRVPERGVRLGDRGFRRHAHGPRRRRGMYFYFFIFYDCAMHGGAAISMTRCILRHCLRHLSRCMGRVRGNDTPVRGLRGVVEQPALLPGPCLCLRFVDYLIWLYRGLYRGLHRGLYERLRYFPLGRSWAAPRRSARSAARRARASSPPRLGAGMMAAVTSSQHFVSSGSSQSSQHSFSRGASCSACMHRCDYESYVHVPPSSA
jgi:hypothetical protein